MIILTQFVLAVGGSGHGKETWAKFLLFILVVGMLGSIIGPHRKAIIGFGYMLMIAWVLVSCIIY